MFARRLDRRELGFLNRHYASIHSENASISRLIRLLDRDDGIGRNGPLITRQKVISDPGGEIASDLRIKEAACRQRINVWRHRARVVMGVHQTRHSELREFPWQR